MERIRDFHDYALYKFTFTLHHIQCLKWSKKEAGLSRNPRSSAPSPEFFIFIFDLKMASFDAFLVVFYAI